MNLLPKPTRFKTTGNSVFILPRELRVEFGGFEPDCVLAFAERCALSLVDGADVWLTLRLNKDLADEEYSLTVKESGVEVEASSERGVIWALVSLYELLDGGEAAPLCEVSDKPRYRHRAQHLDCSRHFFSADEVLRVIEQISLVKMNVLHWHISDDQGWRLESKLYPKLNEASTSFYSLEEVKNIVEFARIRGVEIIPEIDMPGHTSAILSVYPELSCSGEPVQLATTAGIFKRIMCAGKESTFEFIETLLDEICPLFISPRFHIGGDEAPKSEWASCPDCQRRMSEEGISELEDLQGYFIKRVSSILAKHNKKAICWNDCLKASNIPEGTQIQFWTLQFADTMNEYVKKGGEFIYSEMFDVYFDYPHSVNSLKSVYNMKLSLSNKSCDMYAGLLGIESCLWTERVETNERLEQLLFPRCFAVAERAWSSSYNYRDFLARVDKKCFELQRNGLSFTKREMWNPKGKGRRAELLELLDGMKSQMTPEMREQISETVRPSKEFTKAIASRFFKLSDLPLLLKMMK